MGTCRYCGQNAGFLRKQHGQCRELHAKGIKEMTELAALAAGTAGFNETPLRSTLQAIADRARATEDEISQAPSPPAGPRASSTPCRTASSRPTRKRTSATFGTGWPTRTSQRHHRIHHPGPSFS